LIYDQILKLFSHNINLKQIIQTSVFCPTRMKWSQNSDKCAIRRLHLGFNFNTALCFASKSNSLTQPVPEFSAALNGIFLKTQTLKIFLRKKKINLWTHNSSWCENLTPRHRTGSQSFSSWQHSFLSQYPRARYRSKHVWSRWI